MGDFIPQEELEKFMARCNDSAAQKAAEEAAQKAKIQADNIGHKLLSKMGWKEGTLKKFEVLVFTCFPVGGPILGCKFNLGLITCWI
jgi:G-patch domain